MNRWTSHAPQAGRYLATLVIALIGLVAAHWLWIHYRVDPWTRDGRVRADVAEVAPDVSGLVTEVDVHDNMPVQRGQVLFVIDRARYQLALDQADATLQQSEAGEQKAEAAIQQARAVEQQAQADVRAQTALLAEARREDVRNQRLGALVSTEGVEQGSVKVQQLSAALAQAQAAVAAASAMEIQAKASMAGARASVVQAHVARNTAQLNLQRTSVVAPVDGFAADVGLRPGDYLSAGHPAFSVLDSASLHVDGYFEETKLSHIRIGDRATIELMGDGREFTGHVESIAPGIADRERSPSGDLLANVTPTFNWVRLAQRIPVRIHIDQTPANLALIAGRTATVVLHPEFVAHTATYSSAQNSASELAK